LVEGAAPGHSYACWFPLPTQEAAVAARAGGGGGEPA